MIFRGKPRHNFPDHAPIEGCWASAFTTKLLVNCVCLMAGGWGLFFLLHPDQETRATRILASDRFNGFESLVPNLV